MFEKRFRIGGGTSDIRRKCAGRNKDALFCGEKLTEKIAVDIRNAIPGKSIADHILAPNGNAVLQFSVPQKTENLLRKVTGILRTRKKTGYPVLNNIGDAADRRSNDGDSTGEGFHK